MERSDLQMIAFFAFSSIIAYLGAGNHCVRGSIELLIEESESLSFRFHRFMPPISMLDLVGMAVCCIHYRLKLRSKKSWFETLVACTLMHLGGTSLTGVLLGQLPGWMLVNSAMPAVLIAWWLVFCCPYDAFWTFLIGSPAAVELLSLLDILNIVHCITTWGVDKVLHNEFHVNATQIANSYVACIFAGVLSSCGGSLLHSAFHGEKFVLFAIGNYEGTRSINNAFILTLMYYILVNKDSFINIDIQLHSARAIVCATQIYLHVSHLLYPGSNICQWVSVCFLSVTLVRPVIESQQGKRKRH